VIKLSLPFKGKESFPKQFFALDPGGKFLKIVLFQTEGDYVRLLGMKKLPQGDDPANTLSEMIEDLRNDVPDLPKATVVGVSGPMTTAFTTVARSSLSAGTDEIVAQVRETALKQAEEELRRSLGDPKLSLVELEAEILEVKESEKLELYLFTSFGEKYYLRELEGLVRQAGLSLWGFSSLPFNVVDALSSEGSFNALIVDVGGEKTEISLAFGGELMDVRSFWWDFPPREGANTALFLDLWVRAVSDVLSTFTEVKSFPSRIFLTGGGAAIPELVEQVSRFPWGSEHPFSVTPEVAVIGKDDLAGIQAEGVGFDQPDNIPPLSLGRVALRVKEEPEDAEDEEAEKEVEANKSINQ
jgi:hypothetical protein